MLLFVVIYNIAEILMGAVAVFQFIYKLVTDNTNTQLLNFGQSLSLFIYQIWRFLTFNSETLPFPFASWPKPEDSPVQPPSATQKAGPTFDQPSP